MNQSSSDLLSESPGVERVAEAARKTFGADEKAQRWLQRPTTALSGESPLTVASKGADAVQRVLDLLARIDHGLAV